MGAWIFTHIEGSRNTLMLDGSLAPHGRPRQGPVVEDGIEVRQTRTYYPGNVLPTRHIFGTKLSNFEIHGRFRDRRIGLKGARAKVEEVKAFVAESRAVLVMWDDIIAIDGFITKFLPGREADEEIDWKMSIEVDVDHFADRSTDVKTPPDPSADLNKVIDALKKLLALSFQDLLNQIAFAQASFFDIGTGLLDQMTSFASGVSSFATITTEQFSSMGGLGLRIQSYAYAAESVLLTSLPAELALATRTSSSEVALAREQAKVRAALRDLLVGAVGMRRASAAAAASGIKAAYPVREGDTWESIATQFYGSPERAGDLQQAAHRVGQPPPTGTTILIPV
jgi:hypothetical protein